LLPQHQAVVSLSSTHVEPAPTARLGVDSKYFYWSDGSMIGRIAK
jgi:hypothetical protein